MSISAFGPSSIPSNSFVIMFMHSDFSVYFLDCYILFQNRSVSLASSYWYVIVSSPPTCWQNFLSLFWNVLFCLYCFTLCWYLFNLPSFANTFWFISSNCIVIFSSVAFSFLSLHVPAPFLCFIILVCLRRFFLNLRFQLNFPSWFWFFLRAFWGDLNFLINWYRPCID